MEIFLNGEKYIVKHAKTVGELLGELEIKPERVAVEVNLHIVKKSDYQNQYIYGGDSIEVVNFVGGG